MTINILQKQEERKLRLKKICSMFHQGDKRVLQIDLSDFRQEEVEKVVAAVRESCEIATLMGHSISIKKQFVQEEK